MRERASFALKFGVLSFAVMAFSASGNALWASGPPFVFTEVSEAAGLDLEHGDTLPATLGQFMGGGVAAGDFDDDGWIDLYVVVGTAGTNRLMQNQGDGTFEDVAEAAGVDLAGTAGSGPTFADLDGDGHLDLVIGSLTGGVPWLFRNRGDGTFEDKTAGSGLPSLPRVFSIAAADFDRDDDLDLLFSQWNVDPADLLWRNDGGFQFSSATAAALGPANDPLIRTFAPNFAHVDEDGWPDLLMTSDFENSQVLLSQGDGTFALATDSDVIVDQNGMGAAVGDFDNDGRLDWFVSSIYNPVDPLHQLGNRLYRNLGGGSFADVTDTAGVHHGHWAWGSCFADFDNDGRLDIFHVNGWRDAPYDTDPARLFLQEGDPGALAEAGGPTFTEAAAACGIDDRGQGRGVVCFDYDRDGDLDVYIANNSGLARLFRNDGGNSLGHLLEVELRDAGGNSRGVGGLVRLESAGLAQMREIRVASNYASQNPTLAYFGLGEATVAPWLSVEWPGGEDSMLIGLVTGRRHLVSSSVLFSASFETADLSGWTVIQQ